MVTIDHGNGFKTQYLHLQRTGYSGAVRAGQQIGLVGDTGVGTGCHLHFETIVDGKKQNPLTTLANTGEIVRLTPADWSNFGAELAAVGLTLEVLNDSSEGGAGGELGPSDYCTTGVSVCQDCDIQCNQGLSAGE